MVKAGDAVTKVELERLLREDPTFAVQIIDSDYRDNIWRYIRSRCRFFDDDDVHDVYVQTLREFIRCVKKPGFDPKSPLKLIFHIAKWRASDRRRAKKASTEPTFDELLEPIAQDMKDTTTRLNWQLMKSNWPEFRATLEKLIDQLPDKQRDAMNAFVETYWEIRTQGSMRRLPRYRFCHRFIEVTHPIDSFAAINSGADEILCRFSGWGEVAVPGFFEGGVVASGA